MKIVRDTVTVARHRADVFAYLADFRNDTAWRKETIGVRKITTGAIGPGTVFEDTIKYPGAAPVVLTKEITVYETGRRIGFSSRSRSGTAEAMYELADDGRDRTRISFLSVIRPRGLMRVVFPLMVALMRSRQFELLKQELEKQPLTMSTVAQQLGSE
jgi:hypothetical protein